MTSTKRKQRNVVIKQAKYDDWERDAIAYIQKTSAPNKEQEERGNSILILEPSSLTKSRGKSLGSKASFQTSSRTSLPQISTTATDQSRIALPHQACSKIVAREKNTFNSENQDLVIPKDRMPPPAPCPPRLPTPDLEDIPENRYWACCAIMPYKYGRHV